MSLVTVFLLRFPVFDSRGNHLTSRSDDDSKYYSPNLQDMNTDIFTKVPIVVVILTSM